MRFQWRRSPINNKDWKRTKLQNYRQCFTFIPKNPIIGLNTSRVTCKKIAEDFYSERKNGRKWSPRTLHMNPNDQHNQSFLSLLLNPKTTKNLKFKFKAIHFPISFFVGQPKLETNNKTLIEFYLKLKKKVYFLPSKWKEGNEERVKTKPWRIGWWYERMWAWDGV